MLAASAQAELPYPRSGANQSDPYDYSGYKTASRDDLPSDLGEDEWKYSSRTACEIYEPELEFEPPDERFQNCDPATGTAEHVGNPQEQFGVTGASIDRAWTTTTGRPDVVIAVHDSGIKWNDVGKMRDLNTKTWLNFGELPVSGTNTFSSDPRDYDVNEDGVFNIRDYCADPNEPKDCGGTGDARVKGAAASADTDLNGNGIIDPEDLIFMFSDGIDQDENGYKDDFVGWDTYEDDNDPYDEVQYGHGTGEAVDSTAEANNGGGVGTCPNCMVMHMRVGDSFIADVNDFAQGAIYATDNGASVIQSALGTLNNSRFAQEAIDYAYRRGVVLIASAADESAGHHNQPSVLEHAVTFNSIGEPQVPGVRPRSYLEFRGCTNYGAYIQASVPSNSCSSEAVGRMSGVAGLVYSAARNRFAANVGGDPLNPPLQDYGVLDGEGGVPGGRILSAEEIDQLVARTADDIQFTDPPYTERYPGTERYGATPGWDPFFGYGRINARRMVEAVKKNQVPPEADITSPKWFEIEDPSAGPIEVKGFVASRRSAKYSYEVEWGIWSWYEAARQRYQRPDYKSTGVTIPQGQAGDQSAPIDGLLGTIDAATVKAELDAARAGKGTEGPGADPVSGRGDHENRQLPDKFSVIVRVTVTAKDEAGGPLQTDLSAPVDAEPTGGGDPNADEPAGRPLQGIGTKNFFLHRDPALFPGFPKDMQGDGAAAPRFADLDDDGVDELIVATANGEVHAYKHGGGEAEGWPVTTTDAQLNYGAPAYQSGEITVPVRAAILRSPAVGDIDRDGDLEVVVGDFQGRISAWDGEGRMLPGFPVRSDPSFSAPQRPDREVADANGETFYERHPELVPGRYPGPDTDPTTPGLDLPNDPDLVPDLVNRHDKLNRVIWWMLASPTLANVDPATDSLEILAGAADRHLYAFDRQGNQVPGWPMFLRDPKTVGTVKPNTHEITNGREKDDDDGDGIPNERIAAFNGAKIVTSPAVGNLDGDPAGTVEILSTVNEQYRELPNFDDPTLRGLCEDPPDPLKERDGRAPGFDPAVKCGNDRLYAIGPEGRARTGGDTPDPATGHPNADDFLPGWPAKIGTATLELLPVVGNGPDGSPILGDVDTANEGLEVGIFGTAGPGYILKRDGVSLYGKDADGRDRVLLTNAHGAGNNSPDTPTIPALGGAIFTEIQGADKLAFAAPAAALGKLLDVVLPDDQLQSDNQLAIWETAGQDQAAPRNQLPSFPREVNDLQFLTTPAAADIDGEGTEEVLEGTAYSDLHAFRADGDEPGLKALDPAGWPKFTGGWSVAPPAVGDWDGDGMRDIAHVIREGRLFVWKANGAGVCAQASWPEWGHDGWMTNNSEMDAVRPEVITDLRKSVNPDGQVTLAWTAPGDDGRCGGKVHSYEVRKLAEPLTTDNFSSGERIPGAPDPAAPGSAQTFRVQAGLCSTYVAVQSYDGDPAADTPAQPANPSAVSNSILIEGRDPTHPTCPGGRSITEITIKGRRSGQTTDLTVLRARLQTSDGRPLAGALVRFGFQGRSYSATTGPRGFAWKWVRIRGRARSTPIVARFAGSETAEPSEARESFTVLHEDTRMRVDGYRMYPKKRPRRITLRGRLRDQDSALRITGRKVVFYLNGRNIGSDYTGTAGNAYLVIHRRMRRGDRVRTVFLGDRRFLSSSDAGTWRWGRIR